MHYQTAALMCRLSLVGLWKVAGQWANPHSMGLPNSLHNIPHPWSSPPDSQSLLTTINILTYLQNTHPALQDEAPRACPPPSRLPLSAAHSMLPRPWTPWTPLTPQFCPWIHLWWCFKSPSGSTDSGHLVYLPTWFKSWAIKQISVHLKGFKSYKVCSQITTELY